MTLVACDCDILIDLSMRVSSVQADGQHLLFDDQSTSVSLYVPEFPCDPTLLLAAGYLRAQAVNTVLITCLDWVTTNVNEGSDCCPALSGCRNLAYVPFGASRM